jgi:hypothetical protein
VPLDEAAGAHHDVRLVRGHDLGVAGGIRPDEQHDVPGPVGAHQRGDRVEVARRLDQHQPAGRPEARSDGVGPGRQLGVGARPPVLVDHGRRGSVALELAGEADDVDLGPTGPVHHGQAT